MVGFLGAQLEEIQKNFMRRFSACWLRSSAEKLHAGCAIGLTSEGVNDYDG